MRNKVAKQLRKIAYKIPEMPDVDYKERYIQEGPKFYLGTNGKPAISAVIRTSTIYLAPHCHRAWYQSMKKGHNSGR